MVWYYPNVVFVDRELAPQTKFTRDASDFGARIIIIYYYKYIIIMILLGVISSKPADQVHPRRLRLRCAHDNSDYSTV